MKVIACGIDDLPDLATFAKRTFHEAFAGPNDPEDMQAYMDRAFHPDQIRRELLNPDSLFFQVKLDDKTAGYLKVNFANAQTELQDENSLEVERIYVDARFQGKGIGKVLMQKAFEIARAHQLDFVWLGVWEHNEGALAFYRKQGFVPFATHQFVLGQDVQTDILLRKDMES